MKTLVAGIGSPIRTDDGVGVHVARRLRAERLPEGVDVVELGTAGLTLLDRVEGYERLVVVDATLTGSEPGTWSELRGDAVAGAVHLGAWHEADLPTTLAMGRDFLGMGLPEEVIVVAVEVSDITTFSERLTPAVEAAIPGVIRRIHEILGG